MKITIASLAALLLVGGWWLTNASKAFFASLYCLRLKNCSPFQK